MELELFHEITLKNYCRQPSVKSHQLVNLRRGQLELVFNAPSAGMLNYNKALKAKERGLRKVKQIFLLSM